MSELAELASAPILKARSEEFHWLDLSGSNQALDKIDPTDTASLAWFIADELARSGKRFGIGGYGENRSWYRRSPLFSDGGEVRSVHLGVDLWAPAGEPVYSALEGTVHSFRDNAAFGDYGPTVILRDEATGRALHTLYGHLSRSSLEAHRLGSVVKPGDLIGWLGATQENGNWPPHLHFQLIWDLEGRVGDYPGTATPALAARYLNNCPDPNLVLKIPGGL